MKFKIDDEVWFQDQDREEEGYFVCNIFKDFGEQDLIYVAVDCNNCYVVGRDRDFELCDHDRGAI